jgi:hypothetical protein
MNDDLNKLRRSTGEDFTSILMKTAAAIDTLAAETWRGDEIRKCSDYETIKVALSRAMECANRLRPASDGGIFFRKVVIAPKTKAAAVQELVRLHGDLLRALALAGYRLG